MSNSIDIDETVADYKEYWGGLTHNRLSLQLPKRNHESFNMLGIMGQREGRESRSYSESLNEVQSLLEYICTQSDFENTQLISFPNGQIEGLSYSRQNLEQVIGDIDSLYDRFVDKKIMAIGVDFEGEFEDPPGLKSGLTMVYVRTPDDRLAFYQNKIKPDPRDNPIEPFWRMNRQLKVEWGQKKINILFISCGEIFDDRFQTEFHDADVVINLAHRSARGFTKKAFKKRIKETLRDPRSGLGFMTFNQVKHPSHEGSYTIATKQPRMEFARFNRHLFRLELFNLGKNAK